MEAAAEWVFAHPEAGDAMDVQEAAGPAIAAGNPLAKDDFRDGPPSEHAKRRLLSVLARFVGRVSAGTSRTLATESRPRENPICRFIILKRFFL